MLILYAESTPDETVRMGLIAAVLLSIKSMVEGFSVKIMVKGYGWGGSLI